MLQTTLPIVAPAMPCPEPAPASPGAEPTATPGGRFAQALREAGAPDANTEPVRTDAGDAQRQATRRHDGAAEEKAAVERRPAARGPVGARRDGDTPVDRSTNAPATEAAADTAALAATRPCSGGSDATPPAEADETTSPLIAADPSTMAPNALAPVAATPVPAGETAAGITAEGAANAEGEPALPRRLLDSTASRSGPGRTALGAHATREPLAGNAERGKAVDARGPAFATGETRSEQTTPAAITREPAARNGRDTLDVAANGPLPTALARFDNPAVATRAAAGAQATLDAPVSSREFAPALGAQVAVWVRDGVQEARLQLHPAELGPLAIQIALDGSSAQIDFHAAHELTRDAIETSLPALAASLHESGFTLAGGGVFGQGAGGGAPGERGAAPAPGVRALPQPAGEPATLAALPEPRTRGWRRGLLDVFA